MSTCKLILFGVATGIGLLTDKYMLEATNFVEHYAVHIKPDHEQKEFIKSAMYAGAIFGMVTFGPISDFAGRRVCLIACSVITLAGAMLSMFAWSANVLIVARIITGVGMGGEYPLASTHSAESSKDSGDGAFFVALLYLFGSGGGPILCDLVAYCLAISGLEPQYVWRGIFLGGTLLSATGLFLRIFTTSDSAKFKKSTQLPKGTRRKYFSFYWKALVGTALNWFLFDIVEYGLKQNDAAIFSADSDGPYSDAILIVFLTRLLVIPSLLIASWLLKMTKPPHGKLTTRIVQLTGFAGCVVVNTILAFYYFELKSMTVLFDALYIVQLSFQSLPGVTTMAISAEIYPSAVRGTGAAISAASGKLGATLGSFFFTMLKEQHQIQAIFWTVTCTSTLAMLLTLWATPRYNGYTLDAADELTRRGDNKSIAEAVKTLYGGPLEASKFSEQQAMDVDGTDDDTGDSEEASSDA